MAVIYVCPADKRLLCSWEGYASDIKQHFEKEHNGLLFQTDSIEIDLSILHENRLLYLQDEIYLVQTHIKDNRLLLKLRYLGAAAIAAKKLYHITITVNSVSYVYEKENSRDKIVLPTEDGWEVDLNALQEYHGQMQFVFCLVSLEKNNVEVRRKKSSTVLKISNPFIETNICDEWEDDIFKSINLVDSKITELKQQRKYNNEDIMDRISVLNLSILEEPFSTASRKFSVEENKLLMEKADILPDITEEMNVSCASCKGDMLPPIFMCTSGHHNLCSATNCTSCKECGGTRTDQRNTELENISRSHKHPCKFSLAGCREKLLYSELRAHEAQCQFCKYKCLIDGCIYEGKYEEFLNHIKILHSSLKISYSMSNDFPKNTEFYIVNKVTGIFYCKSVQRGDIINWKAMFCGPKERQLCCELYFKGSKIKEPSFLKRQENIFEIQKTLTELKKVKAKEKNAVLVVISYGAYREN